VGGPGDSMPLDLWGHLQFEIFVSKRRKKMSDWFEIFKIGKHTDTSGHTREWALKDLKEIASSYNPQEHEAPIVIGHPETDSPAYGWIEGLKVEGEKLLAKPRQLAEQFKDWVRKGLYKKVSIALYPDLTLRHIGFLGAVPPAVKGLENVRFRERGEVTICFSDIEWEGGMEMSNSGTIDGTKIVPKDFDTAVQKVMKEKEISKGKAIEFCAREYPELHQEYVVNLSVKAKEELGRRNDENLLNPPHFDKDGRKDRERRIYSAAYDYVKDKNSELAQRFAEKLKMNPEEEKALAAGKKIVSLVQSKMKADKGLSYSEALTQVQKENKGLILEYLGK
jgi:hypothetical protein